MLKKLQQNIFDNDTQYFSNKAISSSDLKVYIEKGKEAFRIHKYQSRSNFSTRSMVLGSLVHTLCLEEKEVHNRYYVGNNTLTKQLLACLKELKNNEVFEISENDVKVIKLATAKNILQKHYKSKIKKIEDIVNKHKLDIINLDKIKVSKNIYDQATVMHCEYNNNKTVKQLLSDYPNKIVEQGCVFELKTDYGPIKCKFKPDAVYINEDYNIIQPIDIKTTNNIKNFKGEIAKYKYHYQSTFYRLGLYYCIKHGISDYSNIKKEFEMLPTMLIPISNVYNNNKIDVKTIKISIDKTNQAMTHIQQILNDIAFCLKTHGPNSPWE